MDINKLPLKQSSNDMNSVNKNNIELENDTDTNVVNNAITDSTSNANTSLRDKIIGQNTSSTTDSTSNANTSLRDKIIGQNTSSTTDEAVKKFQIGARIPSPDDYDWDKLYDNKDMTAETLVNNILKDVPIDTIESWFNKGLMGKWKESKTKLKNEISKRKEKEAKEAASTTNSSTTNASTSSSGSSGAKSTSSNTTNTPGISDIVDGKAFTAEEFEDAKKNIPNVDYYNTIPNFMNDLNPNAGNATREDYQKIRDESYAESDAEKATEKQQKETLDKMKKEDPDKYNLVQDNVKSNKEKIKEAQKRISEYKKELAEIEKNGTGSFQNSQSYNEARKELTDQLEELQKQKEEGTITEEDYNAKYNEINQQINALQPIDDDYSTNYKTERKALENELSKIEADYNAGNSPYSEKGYKAKVEELTQQIADLQTPAERRYNNKRQELMDQIEADKNAIEEWKKYNDENSYNPLEPLGKNLKDTGKFIKNAAQRFWEDVKRNPDAKKQLGYFIINQLGTDLKNASSIWTTGLAGDNKSAAEKINESKLSGALDRYNKNEDEKIEIEWDNIKNKLSQADKDDEALHTVYRQYYQTKGKQLDYNMMMQAKQAYIQAFGDKFSSLSIGDRAQLLLGYVLTGNMSVQQAATSMAAGMTADGIALFGNMISSASPDSTLGRLAKNATAALKLLSGK